MKPAVIYARYSSYGQTEQSIEGQVRVCEEFAQANGYVIVNKYIDRATTGTNANRPAFLQMITDANTGSFENIICYKLDRFARNKYDSVVYKHKLKELGVRVISATEVINDSAEGRLVECILEAMAEMFSEDLSMKVKRGLRESNIKGTFTGGYIPLGYKVENKQVVIEESTAKIVREIFSSYASGLTKKEIVANLNARGLKTSANRPFVINSLYKLMQNKKYIGEYYYNGELMKKGYPQIVDRALFDKVQNLLSSRKHKQGRYKAVEDYIFSGKAFCGLCGSPMVGTAGTSKTGDRYYYYNCANKYKNHTCTLHSLNKQKFEQEIIQKTVEHIFNKKNLPTLCKQLERYFNEKLDTSKLDALEKQINDINLKLDKITTAIIDSDSSEVRKRLNEEAKSFELQKQDVTSEIQKLKLIFKMQHTAKDFEDYFMLIAEKADSTDFAKFLSNNFINSIWHYGNTTLVFYDIFDNKVITKEIADSYIQEKSSDKIRATNRIRIQLDLA